MLWEAGYNKVMKSKVYPTNFNVFATSFVSKKCFGIQKCSCKLTI